MVQNGSALRRFVRTSGGVFPSSVMAITYLTHHALEIGSLHLPTPLLEQEGTASLASRGGRQVQTEN
jgi:hypothetical protein